MAMNRDMQNMHFLDPSFSSLYSVNFAFQYKQQQMSYLPQLKGVFQWQ